MSTVTFRIDADTVWHRPGLFQMGVLRDSPHHLIGRARLFEVPVKTGVLTAVLQILHGFFQIPFLALKELKVLERLSLQKVIPHQTVGYCSHLKPTLRFPGSPCETET